MFPLSYSTTQLSVDDVAVARPAQAAVHQAAEGIAALVEVFSCEHLNLRGKFNCCTDIDLHPFLPRTS